MKTLKLIIEAITFVSSFRWLSRKFNCWRDQHSYVGCGAVKTPCHDCGGEGVVAETLCCRVKEKFIHVRWADVPTCPPTERFLSKCGRLEVRIDPDGNIWVALNKKFADGVVVECTTAHMKVTGEVTLTNQNGKVLVVA